MKDVTPSHWLLVGIVLAVLIWSGWQPCDRFTWILEVFPGVVGLIILAGTYQRFRFSTFCYGLIAVRICILCLGGHYTYARVPLGEWVKPLFGWHRNNYDRLGHFAQGFVPAIITRELFIRLKVLNRSGWTFFLVLSVCLGISAFYEFIEWWTALTSGSASISFLGTQGDIWDTQEDMFTAFVAAICALLFFRGIHDRSMARVPNEQEIT
jgi:putative membrane protein